MVIYNYHISIDIEHYQFSQSSKCTYVRFPRKLLHVILTLIIHGLILVLPSLYQKYKIEVFLNVILENAYVFINPTSNMLKISLSKIIQKNTFHYLT